MDSVNGFHIEGQLKNDIEIETKSALTRRYDIDGIRVLAFGLLILYHIGMFYVAEWGWHVKSTYQSEPLQLIMSIVNQWRMPLIFLVSGMATFFLFRKMDGNGFGLNRLKRLGIPLLVGMAIIIPPQAYLEALSQGVIEPGYGQFLIQYFGLQPWPDSAFAGSEVGITWNHLWYLPYLIFYSLLIIPLAKWYLTSGATIHKWLENASFTKILLLPVLPLLFYGLVIFPLFPYRSHALLDDWYSHSMFFTFFCYGFLLAQNTNIWKVLETNRRLLLAMAIVSFAVFYPYMQLLTDNDSTLKSFGFSCVLFLNRWIWILLVLAWGHHLLNRPMGWIQYSNKAVFCWYIFHQTITVIAGFYLSQLTLGPVVEPLLVLLLTVIGCGLAYEMLKRVKPLHRYFGL